jgi:hypothetical protein
MTEDHSLATDRLTWADIVEGLRELVLGPVPQPVRYRRCPLCGAVRPLGYARTVGRQYKTKDLPLIAEYRCGSCDEFSALVVGEEVDINDPDIETVQMVCHWRDPRPILGRFRSCNYLYRAPAGTMTMTQCPRCRALYVGQTYPDPPAPR